MLFTENETNMTKLYGVEHYTKFAKDAFNSYLIEGKGKYVHTTGEVSWTGSNLLWFRVGDKI